MRVVYKRCAGLDIHKNTIVGFAIAPGGGELTSFGTMTEDLHALADWLLERGIRHVAMESTGSYWKPAYNVLEDRGIEVTLANPRDVKNLPGRKTDVADAQWLAELHRHGLIQASFVPSRQQRELRELLRMRTSFVDERSRAAMRLDKVLQGANIKLTSVATDIQGKSARSILRAIAAGQDDPEELAKLVRGRMKRKQRDMQRALCGTVGPHQRLLISELLGHLEDLDRRIERLDQEVAERQRPFAHEIDNLVSIPGVSTRTAEVIIAEIGTDMSRFGTSQRLASWAKMCPGNNRSAGHNKSGRNQHGNGHLQRHLINAARAAGRTRTFLGTKYRRLKPRVGEKKAAKAVGHATLTIAFHILRDGVVYNDLGPAYYDRNNRQRVASSAIKRLERLGFKVDLTDLGEAA
jgi:transposase